MQTWREIQTTTVSVFLTLSHLQFKTICHNEDEDDDYDEDEGGVSGCDDGDEDEAIDYSEMTPLQLYKLCKEREIKVAPKKLAKYYIAQLEEYDAAHDDWEDDDEEEDWEDE